MSKRKKLYFECKDAEVCWPLSEFKLRFKEGFDGDSFTLIEAEKVVGEGFMWCSAHGDCIESWDGVCGKHCPDYNPCNKISGRCRELGHSYSATGPKFILDKNGSLSSTPEPLKKDYLK